MNFVIVARYEACIAGKGPTSKLCLQGRFGEDQPVPLIGPLVLHMIVNKILMPMQESTELVCPFESITKEILIELS